MISVIVPVYNVKPYLQKCVDSIRNQTYQNLEIILVDDGSTDGSGEMCDEYANKDGRVIALHQKNAGQGAARNLGLDTAHGEWVGFVDADDWIDLNYYEKLVRAAKTADADMACCDRRIYDEEGNLTYEVKIVEGKAYRIDDVEDYFYRYFFRYTPVVYNKVYRTTVINSIRFRDVSEVGSEDALFNYEVMFAIKQVTEVEGIAYNNLARKNSTARSYQVGDLCKNYRLLEHMLKIAGKNGISDDTCLCTYNYFNQRTWNQIKVYGQSNTRENLKSELECERELPRRKDFARKMLKLKTLNKMGYRCSGELCVKLIYLLKLINADNLLAQYIYRVFIQS